MAASGWTESLGDGGVESLRSPPAVIQAVTTQGDSFTLNTGHSPLDGAKPWLKGRFPHGRSDTPDPKQPPLCDLAEGELVAQPHAPDLANHVHGDHLESPAEILSRSVEHPGQYWIGTLRFSWSSLRRHQQSAYMMNLRVWAGEARAIMHRISISYKI